MRREVVGWFLLQRKKNTRVFFFTNSYLAEHAVLVANAVPPRRQVERGHGVEEAGREAAEAAVAERGVALVFNDVFQVVPHFGQGFAVLGGDGQAVEGVGQGPAHEKLHGEVVDALMCGGWRVVGGLENREGVSRIKEG
jgi:hypothetical protein